MSRGSTEPVLRILHLDDDPFERERVKSALEGNAPGCTFKVDSVATVAAYRAKLEQGGGPDVAVLDIHLGDDEAGGVTLASETRHLAPGTVILMCSTADDIGTITDCLSAGADDFLSKQSDKGELSLRVFNSYRLAKLKQGGDTGQPTPLSRGHHKPVGSTMERIARRVPLIIDSAITAVFIRGESGTGKEVVADLFAQAMPAGTPFVKVNCGAIAPTLLESELFGHVKGAFTGAANDKRGLFETASGGWIFLDEIATLSPSAQVALLRVLENQEVLRVGSTRPLPITVRVISATNESIQALVKDGRFRSDLWQRLREAEVALPPLCERPDEIPPLIAHFCKAMPGGPYQVSGPALEVLCNVGWREGNVRELRNCLRAMTELHVNKLLTPLAIPERFWDELGERPAGEVEKTSRAGRVVAAKPASDAPLELPWDVGAETHNYDHMTDLLLVAMARRLAGERGKVSLRGLAQTIGTSRSTLSGRLKALVHRDIISLEELSQLVGISDK